MKAITRTIRFTPLELRKNGIETLLLLMDLKLQAAKFDLKEALKNIKKKK